MKKFFALLCMVTALAVTTGCSKTEEPAATPAATTEEAAAPAEGSATEAAPAEGSATEAAK
ncbi:MAG: hypothetical protein L0Z07_02720 [Planctomycetes bacterium]|nr:hypothetical protein [Planctomycetota bacterium]